MPGGRRTTDGEAPSASLPSDLTPDADGAAASAAALRDRGVRLLEVESARGHRYAGWVLGGDVPFRPWLARTLNRVALVVFEGGC